MANKYIVSENGKYFYKMEKDGKKKRVSKDEYVKKTKPRKSKKGGGDNDTIIDPNGQLSWVIIVGSSGNLSPEINSQLLKSGITPTVLGSKDGYDLTNDDGIGKLKTKIKEIITSNGTNKGAVIFVSAERDPNKFETCKTLDTFKKVNGITSTDENLNATRQQLLSLNMTAPVEIFEDIKTKSNVIFVYISSIYVFDGKNIGIPRKEVIEGSGYDFIKVDVDIKDESKIGQLFEKGKNLYAYGKRYVELKLNNIVKSTPTGAKVAILRMDGITPTDPKNFEDGTFLLALSTPDTSDNFKENRYPVFPSQISKVIIGAINKQAEQLGVYHVAGTEKENGITKAQMIYEILKKGKIEVDRKMDDEKSRQVAGEDYATLETDFITKLAEIYNNLKKAKEPSTGIIDKISNFFTGEPKTGGRRTKITNK